MCEYMHVCVHMSVFACSYLRDTLICYLNIDCDYERVSAAMMRLIQVNINVQHQKASFQSSGCLLSQSIIDVLPQQATSGALVSLCIMK